MTAGSRRRANPLGRVWHAFDGLAGDTLWSGIHDLSALVQATVSFRLLQSLGQDRYGAYTGAWGIVGSVGAISFGVGLAMLQRLLGERDDGDEALRSFLTLGVLGSLLGTVVLLVLSTWYIELSTLELVAMLAGELIALSVVTVSSFLVQAASGFQAAVRLRLVLIGIRFVVVTGLFLVGRLTIQNLVIGHLIGFAAYAVHVLVVVLPRHGYTVRFGIPSGLSVRATGTFAIPMVASKAQTDLDKFFMTEATSTRAGGLYAAAYRILLLSMAPLTALDTAAFQRFLPRGDDEQGLHWRRAVKLGSIMVGASVVVGLGAYLCLPLLSFILIEDGFSEAVDMVPWLLLLLPVIATTNGPMNGLLGLGRADVRMKIYLAGAVVAIALYAVLIPRHGWQGAIVSSAVSESFVAVVAWTSLWRHQKRADRAILLAATLPPRRP